MYQRMISESPYLANCVSFSTFLKYKPYWLRPAKWLTCACPKCYEIKCFNKTYARVVPLWHAQDAKDKVFNNTRPPDVAPDRDHETYCWHCRMHNPLHASQPSPSTDLNALFKMSVCEAGGNISPESARTCAHGQIHFGSSLYQNVCRY